MDTNAPFFILIYISFILRKWSNSGVNPPLMCHVYSPVIFIRTQIPQSCTCARPFWKNFQFPHLQNAIMDCKRHGGDGNTRSRAQHIKLRPTAAESRLQLQRQRQRIIKGEGRFALSLHPLPSYRYSVRTTRGCTRRRRKPRLT